MNQVMKYCGSLLGHEDWVTQITTNMYGDNIISSSRDKTLIYWRITPNAIHYGYPLTKFIGHSHFVSDVVSSSDGNYVFSASWDKTVLLWDVNTGQCIRRFLGHTEHVLSVDFSPHEHLIISGGRDNGIKVWDTMGQCKHTITNGHTDSISSVRFSPKLYNPTIVTGSWDKSVKIWNFSSCRVKTLKSRIGYVNAVAISPDGVLCASGGTEGRLNVWNISENQNYATFEINNIIKTLCFNPERCWLSAAVGSSIIVWDLQYNYIIYNLDLESLTLENELPNFGTRLPTCLSLAWSADGHTLFAGYSDHVIRVWKVFRVRHY